MTNLGLHIVHSLSFLADRERVIQFPLAELAGKFDITESEMQQVLTDLKTAGLASDVEYREDGQIRLVLIANRRPVPVAVELAGLSPTEYRIFGDILNRAGYGPLRYTQREQAEFLGMSPNTIYKARRRLSELGFLASVPEGNSEVLVIPGSDLEGQGAENGG